MRKEFFKRNSFHILLFKCLRPSAQAMKSSQGFGCGFLLFVFVAHCCLSAVVTTLIRVSMVALV